MAVEYPAKDYLGRSVADSLQGIIQGERSETAVRIAISALRNTSYTIAQLLDECASAKEAALRQASRSDQAVKVWQLIDSVAAAALRETSCIHETVLKTCARGYAELGPTGAVTYANDALLAFCPDLVGRQLADVFLEADQVKEALATTRCVSAWNKDPVFGVIGIQSGPRDKGPQWLPSSHGSRGWDAGGGDDW